MPKIKLDANDLDFLIPRYRAIASRVSNLAYEIKQMINRLEPSLLVAGDIDVRLISMLRKLQNCEEDINGLISQIQYAAEQFTACDKRLTNESNELIYEFKQILHQIKKNNVCVLPNANMIRNKTITDGLFEAESLINSVKLGYIAEISNIKTHAEDNDGLI